MSENFIKIGNVKIPEFIYTEKNRFDGDKTWAFTFENINYDFLQFVPPHLRDDFVPCLFCIEKPLLKAHVDNYLKCSLNFYMNPNGYTTNFYKVKEQSKEKTFGNLVFEMEDLIFTESFVAEPGDIYFFNSSNVHSVERNENKDNRLFVRVYTKKYSYDDVAQQIIEYNKSIFNNS